MDPDLRRSRVFHHRKRIIDLEGTATMKAHLKRILPCLCCILVLSSCSGAALKSLRGLFKRVPTKELVRRAPKAVPHGKKPSSSGRFNFGDDIARMVKDSTWRPAQSVPSTNHFDPVRYRNSDPAPFKFKTVDVKIAAPNPYMGTSTQAPLKSSGTSLP